VSSPDEHEIGNGRVHVWTVIRRLQRAKQLAASRAFGGESERARE
jgi:hypothetical protein